MYSFIKVNKEIDVNNPVNTNPEVQNYFVETTCSEKESLEQEGSLLSKLADVWNRISDFFKEFGKEMSCLFGRVSPQVSNKTQVENEERNKTSNGQAELESIVQNNTDAGNFFALSVEDQKMSFININMIQVAPVIEEKYVMLYWSEGPSGHCIYAKNNTEKTLTPILFEIWQPQPGKSSLIIPRLLFVKAASVEEAASLIKRTNNKELDAHFQQHFFKETQISCVMQDICACVESSS